MVFSSPTFLFLFLPIVLALYTISPRVLRNLVLLIASLFFYAWGEPLLITVMLASIAGNFFLGLLVERTRDTRTGSWVVASAVAANLFVLTYYKYSGFLISSFNSVLVSLSLMPIEWSVPTMPIGISFFTFHAISYLVDIYRGKTQAQKNVFDLALYITLFPQLIAGPIVRYVDVHLQFQERSVTWAGFVYGIERFVFGLAKKMLLANSFATVADATFEIPTEQLTVGVAWLGIVCYTLQIYFDFSGYSDMAIGLAQMFGFRFLENFNYPYSSRSVTEFWRRWHISLSTWYRDYLYIPLGGNRCAPWRAKLNLVIVFLLCGLWHGASWTFVAWGLFHGAFLVIERQGLSSRLERWPSVLQHAYTLIVVMVGWVLFRADTFVQAIAYLQAMSGFAHGDGIQYSVRLYLDSGMIVTLIVGVVACLPVVPWFQQQADRIREHQQGLSRGVAALEGGLELFRVAVLTLALGASAAAMLASTYNPFIYFRF